MNAPSTSSAARNSTNPKQVLRMRRFFMAVQIYCACAIFIWLQSLNGYLPNWMLIVWPTAFGIVNAGFYWMIRTGNNLRLRDPSMTSLQIVVSILATMILVYHTHPGRGAMLMLIPVSLMFGVLRLRTGQMVKIGAITLAMYAGVIALLMRHRPGETTLAVELMQWMALAGVLIVMCPMVGYMSGIRERLAESLAKIQELARRDNLTGIFNRHDLLTTMQRDIARCEREHWEFALCLIDLDRFKSVNDRFGHMVGDKVLQAVAAEIRRNLRACDYFARYGGEEFAVVLTHGLDVQGLQTACERIRTCIAELHLPELRGTSLTLSLGVTPWKKGDKVEQLIERADKALHRAKTNGCNQVQWEEMPAPDTFKPQPMATPSGPHSP